MANSLLEALNLISMTGLDRPSYIEDPEEALLENREEVLQSLIDISGTIGPIPYHETDEFRQEAFDIAEGLAFPGAGIGASISGGRIAKISEDMWQARGQKLLGKAARNLGRGTKEVRTIDASGKVVKGRIAKTDLDYAKEKIPWWKELRKQGIRFMEGRGDKTFWNKPEILSKTVKPPYVSRKEYTKGLDIDDFNFKDKTNYFFDKFGDQSTPIIKGGLTRPSTGEMGPNRSKKTDYTEGPQRQQEVGFPGNIPYAKKITHKAHTQTVRKDKYARC